MRLLLSGLGVLLVNCVATPPISNSPTTIELCEQTVRDYAIYRDNGPTDMYADLFTADGTFELGGDITKGRDALIKRHTKANEAAKWRHVMGDIRILETEDQVTGVSRFIVMSGSNTTPSQATREIIGHYEDTFAVQDGRCRIKTRKVVILFDTTR